MEDNEDQTSIANRSTDAIDSQCAVNSLILDYYKKFGKKRDLEQFFSLSTAQGDVRDTSGLFWRKMKSENDSSDSGEQGSKSAAHEVCRISIRCSMPDPTSSQSDDKTKTESPDTVSPPIITEEPSGDILQQTDDESIKSDDNHSQKSFDPLLDLSTHKPLSPTSSITSQRKLEWDSLADVGYAYESERKTSSSTLSTLERLALKQQYTNNDSQHNIGSPTCHSTPLDENDNKSKTKKSSGRMTKITKRDVDCVQFNLPRSANNNPPSSIQVNLTKHISFNVEKDGGVAVDNIRREVNILPEKLTAAAAENLLLPVDKEIQTSLTKPKDRLVTSIEEPNPININSQKIPVMISLNTLKKRLRRKKSAAIRRKLRIKRKVHDSKDKESQEKSVGQLSEAESFEYMPGHIYNQNQLKANDATKSRPSNNTTIGNKSSLESSDLTTDSSKGSKHSFTKDLEKCIEVLKFTLQKRYDDGDIKKKLIKEIVKKLLDSKYRDDETTTDFLSGFSFSSKKIDWRSNTTTTNTSDANSTDDSKREIPRKSILRMDKFDSKAVASTSQSAPNLLIATTSENSNANLKRNNTINSESDGSSRGKTSSDNVLPKTSSEELYLKYLEALGREESYKKHLKNKQMFLKQKLTSSEIPLKAALHQEPQITNRLKDLVKDLTRNNYDDGSGDASKLEGGSVSDRNVEKICETGRSNRSHSVFTLSSSNSEYQKKQNIKKCMYFDRDVQAGTSKNHYCCCPHHTKAVGYCDSSVQVNIKCQYEEDSTGKHKQDKCTYCQNCKSHVTQCRSQQKPTKNDRNIGANNTYIENAQRHIKSSDLGKCSPGFHTIPVSDGITDVINDLCLCENKPHQSKETADFMVYKGLKLADCMAHADDPLNIIKENGSYLRSCEVSPRPDEIQLIRAPLTIDNASSSTNSNNYSRKYSKSSQTDLFTKLRSKKYNDFKSEPVNRCGSSTRGVLGSEIDKQKVIIYEATRCLQTEISIDPKISDPSLSDIIIVSNCAELIGERSREVLLNSIDDMKSFSDVCTSSDPGKLSLKFDDGLFQGELKDSDINIIESKGSNFPMRNLMPKDYTIPIQGTNMTLMVSLASSETEQSKGHVSKKVGTEKAPIKEEGTCVTAECSKSVQCQDTIVPHYSKNDTVASAKPISNRGDSTGRVSPGKRRQSNLSPERSPRRNTYPKVVHIKENKPLRRANTDTEKLKTYVPQTETTHEINSTSVAIPLKPIMAVGTHGILDSNSHRSILRSDVANGEKYMSDTKDIGVQKTLSDDESNKKKPAPLHLESRCVGSDIAIPELGFGISCQTDFKENLEEHVTSSATFGCPDFTAQDTHVSRSSIPVKNKSENCGCINICQCEKKETSRETIPKTRTDERSSSEADNNDFKDPIMTIIQDITRRYSKGDITKLKKKKCFNEIVSILNYLLETEESTDQEGKSNSVTLQSSNSCCQKPSDETTANRGDNNVKTQPTIQSKYDKNKSSKSGSPNCFEKVKKKSLKTSESESLPSKRDKSVQLSSKSASKCTESSDMPCSTDRPSTSDSTACKIFNKIKKECEKYHMRRKCGRKCEISSSTSVNCDDCKKVHHCGCRHKCKRSKLVDKLQRKCIAYNLILQTSESMLSEETVCDKSRTLPSVVVKVPKRKDKIRTETCKETIYRIEKGLKNKCSPHAQRSRSCPKDSEQSSNDEFIRQTQQCTVREYLERNRPDFVEKSEERQNCLKFINEMRATERAAHRDLLSLQVDKEPDLTKLTTDQLRELATQIGLDLRRKKPAPKFISEREMKKHSEKIYKTLPEVIQKKEEKKKENIKKTNLLMANIFKKNLQKKTLRGSVNISNYSAVIKI